MNRLASEPSPYLRSAAHQPVHWRAFAKEAFDEARAADKPVLLDVGAVWCHWCHVMDGESYDDAATARVINELFVPVKVDRDERPDVDARYQRSVQALTGQGGWPLTAFLLPDGRCFYGGTYFPPVALHGRPAFRDVLEAVARFYRDEKAKALDQAGRLSRALAPAPAPARTGVPDARLLAEGERALRDAFDTVNGGFGGAPKFPHTGSVLLALRRAQAGALPLRAVALDTLHAMARGGIHDRVGGGFHRYATDARWIVPHFEKMLYDNAELLRAYVHGFQATGDPAFRTVAEGVLRFADDVLWRPRGGWGASQDADVAPADRPAGAPAIDDGSHFTWTRAELDAALGPDLARLAALAWGVGEVEGEVHMTPGRHVLFRAVDDDALAAGLKDDVASVRARLDDARRRLKEARDGRAAPFVDPTVYVSWNAMMASAHLEAAAALDRAEARERALAALARILDEAWDPERGAAHRVGDDGPAVWGLLDDQAQLLAALVEAHVQTGDARWLEAARRVSVLLRRDWADPRGGYADTAAWARADAPVGVLAEPDRPLGDAPTPGANAVAALAHARLHLLTGDAAEREAADAILQAFAHDARRQGVFAATYLLALDATLDPPPHVTVVAAPGEAAGDALARAALAAYAPGKVVARLAPGSPADGVPPEVRGMLAHAGRGPVAFVCRGASCAPPTADPEAVARLVGKVHTAAPAAIPREYP